MDVSQADPFLAVLALAYGGLAALAPLIQLHRVARRRSSADISLTWLALYGGGCVVWLLYGASAGSTPLVVSQAVGLVSGAATFVVAWRFRDAHGSPPAPVAEVRVGPGAGRGSRAGRRERAA
jgi:uncharacterized protein with PQ loop repeat